MLMIWKFRRITVVQFVLICRLAQINRAIYTTFAHLIICLKIEKTRNSAKPFLVFGLFCCVFLVGVTDLCTLDLAAERLRELVDILDHARVLIGRSLALDVIL